MYDESFGVVSIAVTIVITVIIDMNASVCMICKYINICTILPVLLFKTFFFMFQNMMLEDSTNFCLSGHNLIIVINNNKMYLSS